MNTHHIILGDCIEGMKTLSDKCVQTCITSPPYFGLRDYGGGDSEIGQEDTVEGYVQKMTKCSARCAVSCVMTVRCG